MRLIYTATSLVTASLLISQTVFAQDGVSSREFNVVSADGSKITGQVDFTDSPSSVAVVMVAGTGLFDRDVKFGKSGTDEDYLFKSLSGRLTKRGLAVVRYDRRGVRYGQPASSRLDLAVSGSSTVQSQREDLAAVYQWARGEEGFRAKCAILLGHSEGTLHIARLAASGAPAPLGVIGIGAVGVSPQASLRWQISERDAFSLREMDVDRDGQTTAAEIRANWRKTPSSAFDALAPLLPADGQSWTSLSIKQVETNQRTLYEVAKASALSLNDTAPYPNAATPMAANSWWKSWFVDEVPAAQSLASWSQTPIYFHWGSLDSQTPPSLNKPAAERWLGSRLKPQIHAGLGHSLGQHALYGPMDPVTADTIAEEAVNLARRCR